ncbi:tyrosine-type recombinase/integrase [Bacillota bacterium LX-D]|nr:tyrosine-type recombinase/integrase [Bacillota bacterium LX-D]
MFTIELVQPIKDMGKIIELKREMMRKNYKYYMVCIMAFNTGMRIGDIISLKVSDVKNKTHIAIRKEKTNKTKLFPINGQLREEINNYINGMKEEDYLFEKGIFFIYLISVI